MHNKGGAGEKNAGLQQLQSDSVARWVRTKRQPGGEDALPDGTPIIILGDLNVLPSKPAHHLTTLLSGDIADEKTYGLDFKPDWDGTDLGQAKPSHNSQEQVFHTWRRDDKPFPPGALSRILYTDSVLSLNHSFVLNTTIMTSAELNEAGLLETDVLWEGTPGNFDHMPVVADFSIRSTIAH